MSNSQYLAITVGPIYRTIKRARKTRELWAASYVFSLLMRRLLWQLKSFEVIVPDIRNVSLDYCPHGAGLWHDRCIVGLDNDLPDVQGIVISALNRVAADLKFPKCIQVSDLFAIRVLHADWSTAALRQDGTNGNKEDQIDIHRLNRLLDNLELEQHYQPIEEFSLDKLLRDHIHDLYDVADHKGSTVFISMNDGSVRLPSLPEIALQEIKAHKDYCTAYKEVVEKTLNEKIVGLRREGGRSKDLDGPKENEQFYNDLKAKLPKNSLLLRHKYIAVVVADGDSLGKTITRISQGEEDMSLADFSQRLRTFSIAAVEKIADYHGLPVYAGGDDLLFMAPVTVDGNNVISLCRDLNMDFQKTMGVPWVSLSFGVSINYYKYPLGEAVESAYQLEKKAKSFKLYFEQDKNIVNDTWLPRYAKNALCFQVQKHSGQYFGANLWMGSPSIMSIIQLLKSDANLDRTFLTSVMHKLQELPGLFADAARNDRLDSFRLHHFNEGGKHNKEYLGKALQLAEEIFREYGDALDPEIEKTWKLEKRFNKRTVDLLDIYHTEILFAVLRLKQFLIQDDHD